MSSVINGPFLGHSPRHLIASRIPHCSGLYATIHGSGGKKAFLVTIKGREVGLADWEMVPPGLVSRGHVDGIPIMQNIKLCPANGITLT